MNGRSSFNNNGSKNNVKDNKDKETTEFFNQLKTIQMMEEETKETLSRFMTALNTHSKYNICINFNLI